MPSAKEWRNATPDWKLANRLLDDSTSFVLRDRYLGNDEPGRGGDNTESAYMRDLSVVRRPLESVPANVSLDMLISCASAMVDLVMHGS